MTMTRRTAFQIAALAVAALPLTGCSYNTFVGQEEAIKGQWAQVENQLQRRNDLIPNLVETTKGFAQHEESVYKDIADARSRLLAAKSPDETIAAANQQTSALGRLLAVVENYPQLKANEQFNRQLRSEEPRLNSSHQIISYAVFCLKKKKPHHAADHLAETPSRPPKVPYAPTAQKMKQSIYGQTVAHTHPTETHPRQLTRTLQAAD